jgi:microcystin-dependent protein
VSLLSRFCNSTQYSGTTPPPANWLECNGIYVRQDEYNELFQVILDTYGPTGIIRVGGKSFSTFKLPDRRGYVAVGIGSDDSTDGRVTNATAPNIILGKTFGEERHTLTVPELAAHSHRIGKELKGNRTTAANQTAGGNIGNDCFNTENVGGNQPHNNMQPSIFMKFYIRAK